MRKVTRGHGSLEGLLAKLRCQKADSLIPNHLREGRLLDVGSGSYPLFLLQTSFREKYGMDITVEDDCAIHGLNLIKHDFHSESKLPFDDGYFSAVTMLAVFEHIEPEVLPFLISEIRRVLIPGGAFVLTSPAFWTDRLLRVMASLKLVSDEEIRDHKRLYSAGLIRKILVEEGFAESNVQVGYFEFFLNIWAYANRT